MEEQATCELMLLVCLGTVRSMRELISPSSWLMEVGFCHSFLAKSAGLFSAALRAFPECFEIGEKSKDCAMESRVRRYS